jgi:hypothetical protein
LKDRDKSNKMKVLFLDIDGVCNSRAYLYRLRAKNKKATLWYGIDPEASKLIKRIVKETGCMVVLSSTWRLYADGRAQVKREVCHFIDCTKDLQAGAKRGVVERGIEVQEWLARHPQVTHYAILDDDADFLPDQWLFKTTFNDGITEPIAQAVIDHLNAPERAYA